MEELRTLRPEDYLAVWSLAKDLERSGEIHAGFFWPPELLIAEFQTQRSFGILTEGQVAALLIFKEQVAAIEILALVTHPDFRGRGYMKRILEKLQSLVVYPQEIWLEVHCENLSARNLYEKMGFKVTGERPRYYRDGNAAYVLSWKPQKGF